MSLPERYPVHIAFRIIAAGVILSWAVIGVAVYAWLQN